MQEAPEWGHDGQRPPCVSTCFLVQESKSEIALTQENMLVYPMHHAVEKTRHALSLRVPCLVLLNAMVDSAIPLENDFSR